MTDEADDLLSAYGDHLRAETTGSSAPLTRRYPTIAFRIALVHAASELVGSVGIDHVRRAIALCEYGRASLPFVFADTLGNAQATHLLRMLQQSESGVLTLTDLGREFMRDPIKRQVVIDDLCRLGLAEVVRTRTKGGHGLRAAPRAPEGGLPRLLRTVRHRAEARSTCLPSVAERAGEVRRRSAEGAQKPAEGAEKAQKSEPCERYVDHEPPARSRRRARLSGQPMAPAPSRRTRHMPSTTTEEPDGLLDLRRPADRKHEERDETP